MSTDMNTHARVLTWNINAHPDRREERLHGLADEIEGADIALLQECWDGAGQSLEQLTGMHVCAQASAGPGHTNLILSRHRGQEMPALRLPPGKVPCSAARARIELPTGQILIAHSTHLAWGIDHEGTRKRQLQQIEDSCAEHEASTAGKDAIFVLGGDFNTTEHSSAIRYITGLDAGENGLSTMWVDAWAHTGKGEGCPRLPGCTSCPDNPHASATARIVGIDAAHLLPHRRIDYLLVRGYAHGRAGCPLDARILGYRGAHSPSDHYGIRADLWTPAGN